MSKKAWSKSQVLRTTLIYHFCRLQLPGVSLSAAAFEKHLERTFAIFERKAGSLSCGRLCLFVGKLARKDREITSLKEQVSLRYEKVIHVLLARDMSKLELTKSASAAWESCCSAF